MKVRAFLTSLILLLLFSAPIQAASVCNIELPGTYNQSGHDPSFEIEVFKKMPHFQYYLRSKTHPLSLIVGEKILSANLVRSLNKNTIDLWAQKQLKSTLDIYSETKIIKKSVSTFIGKVAGYKMNLLYNNQYEKRLLIIGSLDCAIEFIAIGSQKNRDLVERTISNFLATLKGHKKKFWVIPNAYWYTDLGPANQVAITILMMMITISIGLVFYVRKTEL